MNKNLKRLLNHDATQAEIDRFNQYYSVKRQNEQKEFSGWINKPRLDKFRLSRMVARARSQKTEREKSQKAHENNTLSSFSCIISHRIDAYNISPALHLLT